MIIFSSDDLELKSLDTFRTTATDVKLKMHGAKPGATYTVALNDQDASFICKPFGKNLGDPIVADEYGDIDFTLLLELPYEGTYAFDNVASDASPSIGAQESPNNYHKTSMNLTLSDGENSFNYPIPVNILVTPGHTNRSEFHGH